MGNPVLPPVPGAPPGFVSPGEIAQQEIDPRNAAGLAGLGFGESGSWEHMALAIWHGLVKSIQTTISIVAGHLDELLSLIADFFLAAQANDQPGFYKLLGALITDLTGVDVDGAQLFQQFQQRGRVAAMQSVGSQFVDVLASEFAGITQTNEGGVFKVSKGDGIGGLPAVQLTPDQGMNAARSFLGFAMSFAVREGNTDFFAHLLPWGLGEGFKGYAEDLSKSLGLGRLTRLALRPIFQNLLTIPMTWAFNKQYTPTLLSPGEAVRAFNEGLFSGDELNEELARHGYNTQRRNVLQAFHSKYPSEADLFLLELANQLPHAEHLNTLRRIGYSDDNAQLLLGAEAIHLKRQLSIRLAENLIHQLLIGNLDLPTYSTVLDRFTLSDEEKRDLIGYASELLGHPRKRLTFAQMTSAFVQGIVSVDEVAAFLHDEGYKTDDIAILLQLDLFKLKDHEAKAAAAKAKQAKSGAGSSTSGTAGG